MRAYRYGGCTDCSDAASENKSELPPLAGERKVGNMADKDNCKKYRSSVWKRCLLERTSQRNAICHTTAGSAHVVQARANNDPQESLEIVDIQ